MRLHRNVFTRTKKYTQKKIYTWEPFTQRLFYRHFFHRSTFYTGSLVRTEGHQNAQSTSQHHFVLQALHKELTSIYYFVRQSLHKVLPSTTLYYKAGTKHAPVLLCTTKVAQRTSHAVLLCTTKLARSTSYYFV